jgi:hypothetical protein
VEASNAERTSITVMLDGWCVEWIAKPVFSGGDWAQRPTRTSILQRIKRAEQQPEHTASEIATNCGVRSAGEEAKSAGGGGSNCEQWCWKRT